MSLEQKKIMVVKIGSSTLVTGEGKLDTAYLATLASQISGLRQRGWSPIIVTSGAVACGLEALGISMRPSDTPSLQAFGGHQYPREQLCTCLQSARYAHFARAHYTAGHR